MTVTKPSDKGSRIGLYRRIGLALRDLQPDALSTDQLGALAGLLDLIVDAPQPARQLRLVAVEEVGR